MKDPRNIASGALARRLLAAAIALPESEHVATERQNHYRATLRYCTRHDSVVRGDYRTGGIVITVEHVGSKHFKDTTMWLLSKTRRLSPGASERSIINAICRCYNDVRDMKRTQQYRDNLYELVQQKSLDGAAGYGKEHNLTETYKDMTVKDCQKWTQFFRGQPARTP